MAAAVSETTLQNIEEEVEEGLNESTELEKDPVELKKERTTAKSTHTRVMNKVWLLTTELTVTLFELYRTTLWTPTTPP